MPILTRKSSSRSGPGSGEQIRTDGAALPHHSPLGVIDKNSPSPYYDNPSERGLESALKEKILRIAFYTHDTLGLGHTQRVVKLCAGLTKTFSDAHCLILTGLEKAGLICPSTRVDFVRVPGVVKTGVEKYKSRRLGISIRMLTSIRTSVLGAAVDSFRPDLLIVDNSPLGMGGELRPLLERIKTGAKPVKTALLLRDVLDVPRHIKTTWAGRGDYDALCRLYDLILVFSSPDIFNPVEAYDFPPAAAKKTRFCGYLSILSSSHTMPSDPKSYPVAGAPLVIVTVGGGEDGFPLIWAYLQGVVGCPGLERVQHFILLGPYIPETKRNKIVAAFGHLPNLFIHYYVRDIDHWIRASDLVVSMGGYNTVYEVLSLRKNLIVMPRIFPRQEQLIRAKTLARLGLLDILYPDQLNPESICRKVKRALSSPPLASYPPGLKFDGVQNAIRHLQNLLQQSPSGPAEDKR